MQSLVCLLAQHVVFEGASSLLKEILGINLSGKQIQRVSEWYGKQIDPIIEANQSEYIPQLPQPKTNDERTYVMLDGSMVYTREEKWKEMKLARLFHESQNVGIQKSRNEIVKSVYVSHLGSVDGFCPKLERHMSTIKTRKVFITDGAKWIWNWVEDNYPGSTQILDYYHAVEKIENLARLHFKGQKSKKKWLDEQKKLLMEDGVANVINNLQHFKSKNAEVARAKQTAIRYYTEHEDRMMYKTYKSKGLLIGSGPIEAAHRNVIQQRMKLSGQKWSKSGVQAIANLRCYHQSGAWNIVKNLIKLAA